MTNEVIIAIVGVTGSIVSAMVAKKRAEKTAGALVAAQVAEDAQKIYRQIINDLQLQNEKLLEDRDYYLTENIRITKENQELRSEVQRISNEMQKLIIKVELFHNQMCKNENCQNRNTENQQIRS